jgi:alkylation response protein AidB-like acyl-CoA dehydrogenase
LPEAFRDLDDDRVSVALLEPGRGWSVEAASTTVGLTGLDGRKVAVEHASDAERLAVVASAGTGRALVLVAAGAPGVFVQPQPSLDVTIPMHAVTFSGADVDGVVEGDLAAAILARLTAVGALLAAAESVGAASRMLDDARAYASERRQFGRTIGSYQALRHILADMYVRETSAWSTVLYGAAALDDDLREAQQTAAVAKAYAARAAREVAHGALQVFGGIAFTQEHLAHRFLRRIVVREQQFGDAAHHERELGRALAQQAARDDATTPTTVS